MDMTSNLLGQCTISKIITARSSKLGQLIEEMRRLPGENLKNRLLPFAKDH